MTEQNPEAPKTDLSPIKDYRPVWQAGITYDGFIYVHPVLVDFLGEIVGIKTASRLHPLKAIDVFHKGSWICTAKMQYKDQTAKPGVPPKRRWKLRNRS